MTRRPRPVRPVRAGRVGAIASLATLAEQSYPSRAGGLRSEAAASACSSEMQKFRNRAEYRAGLALPAATVPAGPFDDEATDESVHHSRPALSHCCLPGPDRRPFPSARKVKLGPDTQTPQEIIVMGQKLYVGNLSYNTPAGLGTMFSPHGPVRRRGHHDRARAAARVRLRRDGLGPGIPGAITALNGQQHAAAPHRQRGQAA